MTIDDQEIENKDLSTKFYSNSILIKNIDNLDLVHILKTQHLDMYFVINYIMNKEYQIMPSEEDIDIHDVIRYQPHLKQYDIIREYNERLYVTQ
jgi:hypothetical protein